MGGKSSRQQHTYADSVRRTAYYGDNEQQQLQQQVQLQQQQLQQQQQQLQQQQRQQLQQQARPNLCRQIRIRNGDKGYGYDKIFRGLLDSSVVSVEVDDPYVMNFGQILNFVKFCELLVANCRHVKTISLSTKQDERGSAKEQDERLNQVKSSLHDHGIALIVKYSRTLHDREVRFSTGWVVSLGRGLDYFKPLQNRLNIGTSDLNLRACHETNIHIFHRDMIINGYGQGVTLTRR